MTAYDPETLAVMKRHPSYRNSSPDPDDRELDLVQEDALKTRASLADLYKKARDRGLVSPRKEYKGT